MIYELRQYTLHPGGRETLIDLFDSALTEGQEAVGMTIVGLFRQPWRPDMFVWVRGFPDMDTRKKMLEAFYYGPVWQQHRDAANATMIDSDNVLLLRPVIDFHGNGGGQVVVTIFDEEPDLSTVDVIALLRTEHSENTFPALPVRAEEDVFVLFSHDVVPGGREQLVLTPTERSRLA